MKKNYFLLILLIFVLFSNKLQSQATDTQPPVPYITKTECCGQPYGFSYVIDEPRNHPSIRSNIGIIEFNKQLGYNFIFKHNQFTPGMDDSVAFTIEIMDIKFDAKAIITFADMAGNDTTIEVNYYAIKLIPDVNNLSFGFVNVGSQKSYDIRICNASKRDFVLDYISLDSSKANVLEQDDFSIELLTKDSAIKQNDCLEIRITYKPEEVGKSYGYIVLADKCNYKETLVTFVGHSNTTNVFSAYDKSNPISWDGKIIEIEESKCKTISTFEVFDVFGNRLIIENHRNGKLDISHFSSGVYFVKYDDVIKKIIKF